MSAWRQLLRLDRVTTQIALVVFVGGFVSSIAIGFVLFFFRPDREPPEVHRIADELGSIVRVLDGMPQADRMRAAALYRRPDFSLELDGKAASGSPAELDELWTASLARVLPKDVSVVSVGHPEGARVQILLRLGDGQSVLLRAGPDRPSIGSLPPPLPPLGVSLMVMVALTVALSIWAVLRIVTPLARFATAVEQFGLKGEGGPLREEGAAEVRKATNAFNNMRERIQRLIEDRTRTMIAISHDLRTPLTRLRLRAEDIVEPGIKDGMLRDMDLMETSIAGAVSYLRDGGFQEGTEMADLPSLLETICDQFSDAGFSVRYEGPERLAARVRPQAIARAVTNLVENGTKFGSHVAVRLSLHGASVQIDVEDDGPGIPDSEKSAVLQPFYRSDTARDSVAGFGLGLAIAADVARLHDGTLTLHDRLPRGLRACLRIPLAAR
ncbi:Signal transduction histidine kinase [Enhydrobacter aerosaccus]|uniref:histidine kinase n=1 Tax=Enhydrobacter aerosaccus TaxID=225324 RepID=A0A1T4SPT5_9HYPH|nr:ATP-binding protein [Enhydrobacter aerosaccus]SKA30166.1 Signal transduction histidine kinase [Enhydrobacter aerosaccus]